jgi:hypothetical protein
VDILAVASAVLALALVIAAVAYARRMVERSQRPAITASLELAGPGYADLRLRAVGAGPALDVALDIAYERAHGADYAGEIRPWRAAALGPGTEAALVPPFDGELDAMAARVAAIRVRGTARDALGREVTLEADVEDVGAWCARARRLAPAGEPGEPRRAIERGFRQVTKELKGIREATDGTQARREEAQRERLAEQARLASQLTFDADVSVLN